MYEPKDQSMKFLKKIIENWRFENFSFFESAIFIYLFFFKIIFFFLLHAHENKLKFIV